MDDQPLSAAELDEIERVAETFARRSRVGMRPTEILRLVAMARRGLELEEAVGKAWDSTKAVLSGGDRSCPECGGPVPCAHPMRTTP